jgi:hypothetical protein
MNEQKSIICNTDDDKTVGFLKVGSVGFGNGEK